ncbi:hypothetical protein CP8484711_0652B, partial [Chlamydia psittaci 84-8471/1]
LRRICFLFSVFLFFNRCSSYGCFFLCRKRNWISCCDFIALEDN